MSDVPVNRQLWEALSSQQQAEVTGALRRAGALKDGDEIVPSDEAPAQTEKRDAASVSAGAPAGSTNSECVEACAYIYSMATQQCGDIPDPDSAQACMNAANNVYDECLKNC